MKNKIIILLLVLLCSCTSVNQHSEEKTISKLTDKFVYTNGVCLRDNVKIYYSSYNRGDSVEITDEDEECYYVKNGGLTLAIQKDYIRTENDQEFSGYRAYTQTGAHLYSNIERSEVVKTFSLNDEVNVIDKFAGMLLIEVDGNKGYMIPTQVSKNKFSKHADPKPAENETYTPESYSGGGGGSSPNSSSPDPEPSAPPQSSGDGEDMVLVINIPKYIIHFISYKKSINGIILMDDTKSYITIMNRNDPVYILDENDNQYIILINGYKGMIDKKYVRKENEDLYEKMDVYTISGATIYKDFDMKEKMFMFGINEKITIIDEVDNVYVAQMSSGEVGYIKKASVSKKKIVIVPKAEKPETNEETPLYSDSSGGGSSSSSSPATPPPTPPTEDWTPAVK